jgi:hypothetical protein
MAGRNAGQMAGELYDVDHFSQVMGHLALVSGSGRGVFLGQIHRRMRLSYE